MGTIRKIIEEVVTVVTTATVTDGDENAGRVFGKAAGSAFDPERIKKTADRMMGEPGRGETTEQYIERRDEKIEMMIDVRGAHWH
ncbi:hypothetical protein ACIQBJ_14230 [Kitasatospora sp. NPDC088391]|uniref:hypothetical protein n=1 Tax=Kitasatospora sp. NPDC088391 TaxID=3364074 RepID=UPI0037F4A119